MGVDRASGGGGRSGGDHRWLWEANGGEEVREGKKKDRRAKATGDERRRWRRNKSTRRQVEAAGDDGNEVEPDQDENEDHR